LSRRSRSTMMRTLLGVRMMRAISFSRSRVSGFEG
jgi:hypothetical protein